LSTDNITDRRCRSSIDCVAVLQLVGVHEIAELLDVSRQRVDRIAATDDSFPPPVAVLAAGRIWHRADIEQWAADRAARRSRGRKPDQ
jgi:prophage regulatory protein